LEIPGRNAFKGNSIYRAGEAENLRQDLHTVTDGELRVMDLSNIFNYRNHILEKLKDFKSYEEQRYIIKGKLLDKLISIYEKLCKDYPQE
jgi:hypothetical protein